MARNFRELEAKMSPKSRARSEALVKQYRAVAKVPPKLSEIIEKAMALSLNDRGLLIGRLIASLDKKPAVVGTVSRFKKLDELGSEPFGEDGSPPTPKK